MQRLMLIFSRCEKSQRGKFQFHFKGYYCGEKIKKLVVTTNQSDRLEVSIDYLLWARKIDVIDGVLEVKLIKYKMIK